MQTLVLGLGNPILRDDGIGPRVARELEGKLIENVTVAETSLAGLNLLDLMVGYDKVIIIDAIKTDKGRPGRIYHLNVDDFQFTRHAASTHDINLATALELGKKMGLLLPQQIDILAIDVEETDHFGEELTPEVEEAIPVCLEMILAELTAGNIA